MTNLSEKKNGLTGKIGFLTIIVGCLAIVLAFNWIKSSQNLCDQNSPYGCHNIYRVGGTVDIGESLALSADGRFLAISNSGSLMVLDTETGDKIASTSTGSNPNSSYYPINVAISPNGKYAATIMNNNGVLILSTEDNVAQFIESESPNIGSPFASLFFSTDNRYLLFDMYNWQEDKTTIIRYDLEKKTSEPFINDYILLALSPDGTTLAIQTGSGIEFWRYSDTPYKVGELALITNSRMSAALSPDEKTIAVSFHLPDARYNETTTQLIVIETGEVLYDAPIGSVISGLAFTPDGKYLLYHRCYSSFTKVNEQGRLSGIWVDLDLLESSFNTSGTQTCGSNAVMDINTNLIYYGSHGKIGRFDIPDPYEYLE